MATITKPSYLKLGGLKMLKGEFLNDEKREGALITSSVAQVFGKSIDEMIGKEMTFTFFVPKSEGVSGESMQSSSERIDSSNKYNILGVVEGEDSMVYLNLSYAGNVKIEKYSQAKVKCQSNEIMAQVREKLEGERLLVSALSDTVAQANQVFGVIRLILMLFGIIALVVSAIGMFNTMTIALLERTEEIGIMKSIGASDGAISLMFIMESTIMGFLGGLLGIIIGWAEGEIFNGVINFIATRFGGEKVDLFYSPLWFILIVIVFAAFVGFLTGVIPARRASRIDPLDALRYK
jgi:putative ABC transport system permease protein